MLFTSASSVGIHFPSESLFCWVGLFIFGLLLFAKPNRASDFYIYLFFFFVNSNSHLFKPQIINSATRSPSCVELFTLFRESKLTEWKLGGKTASLKLYKNKDNGGTTLPAMEEFPSIFYEIYFKYYWIEIIKSVLITNQLLLVSQQ